MFYFQPRAATALLLLIVSFWWTSPLWGAPKFVLKTLAEGVVPKNLRVADINNDGKLDLVYWDESQQKTCVLTQGPSWFRGGAASRINTAGNLSFKVPFARYDRFNVIETQSTLLRIFVNDDNAQLPDTQLSIDYSGSGTLSVQDNGILYTPALEATGSEHFQYTLENPEGRSTGQVDITLIHDDTIPKAPHISGAEITNQRRPSFIVSSASDQGIGHFRFKLNDLAPQDLSSENLQITFQTPVPLELGAHTLSAQESNAAGVWSGANVFHFHVQDTQGPNIDMVKPQQGQLYGVTDFIMGGTFTMGSSALIQESLQVKLNGDILNDVEITADSFVARPNDILTEGQHQLWVSLRDENHIWTSANISFSTSDEAPNAPLILGPSYSDQKRPLWTWFDGENNSAVYRVSLDGQVQESLQSQAFFQATHDLEDGPHELQVWERNDLGNWSPPGSKTITIDLEPPPAPKVSGSAPSSHGNPQWNWQGEHGDMGTFRYRWQEDHFNGSEEPSNATHYEHPETLGSGQYTLYVQEQDQLKRWSPSGSFTVTVDQTGPQPPILTWSMEGDRLRWDWSSGGDGSGQFRYRFDDRPWNEHPIGQHLHALTPVGSPEGTYRIEVIEEDEFGNPSTVSTSTAQLSFSYPKAPIVNISSPSATARPKWTWSSGGDGDGWYRLGLNSQNFSEDDPVTRSRSFTPDHDLSEGAHQLYVQERNHAGRWSPVGKATVILDFTGPAAPIVSGPSSTEDPTPTWTWSSGGAGGSGFFRYRLDQQGEYSPWEKKTSFTPDAAIAPGQHLLEVQEKDPLGNVSVAGTHQLQLTPSSLPAPVVQNDSPSDDSTPTWTWTSAPEGQGIFTVSLDSPELRHGFESKDRQFTPLVELVAGEHTLYVWEKDVFGAWSAMGQASVHLNYEGIAPKLIISPKQLTVAAHSGMITPLPFQLELSPPNGQDLEFLLQPDTQLLSEHRGSFSNPGSYQLQVDAFSPGLHQHEIELRSSDASELWGSVRVQILPLDHLDFNQYIPEIGQAIASSFWGSTWDSAKDMIDQVSQVTSSLLQLNFDGFQVLDAQLIENHVQKALEHIQNTEAEHSQEERDRYTESLDDMLENEFAQHSITQVLLYDHLCTLAEAHWQKHHSKTAALMLSELALSQLKHAAPYVSTLLTRMAHYQYHHVPSTAPWEQRWQALLDHQNTLLRYKDYFPQRQDSFQHQAHTMAAHKFQRAFAEQLGPEHYNQDLYLAAENAFRQAHNIANSSRTAWRLERVQRWKRLPFQFTFVDQFNQDLEVGLELTFSANPELYLDSQAQPQEISRSIQAKKKHLLELMKDQHYRFTATLPAGEGQSPHTVSLAFSDLPHKLGIRYHVGSYGITQQALASPQAPSEIVFVMSGDHTGAVEPHIAGAVYSSEAYPSWTLSSMGQVKTGIYRYRINDGAFIQIQGDPRGITVQHEQILAEGLHRIDVQEQNFGGIWSTLKSFETTVDRTPPPAPSFTNPNILKTPTPTWSWMPDDSIKGYRYAYGAPELETAAVTPQHSFTEHLGLTIGLHSLHLQQCDHAGNWSPIAVSNIDLQYDPIAAPIITAPIATSKLRPLIQWQGGGEGLGEFRVAFDRELLSQQSSVTETFTTPERDWSDGLHRVTIAERDAYNNWSASSVNILIDSTAPEASWNSPAEGAIVHGSNLQLQVQLSDALSDLEPRSIRLSLDGHIQTVELQTLHPSAINLSLHLENLKNGSHQLQLECSDALGNRHSSQREFFVNDHYDLVLWVNPRNGDDSYDGQQQEHSELSAGPLRSIQAAMSRAQGHHTLILLQPGLYIGPSNRDLVWSHGNLNIQGQGEVIVDIQNLEGSRAIHLTGGELQLEGLHFRGGHAANGGAILQEAGQLSLERCVFHSNFAERGGAICVLGGSLMVQKCEFQSNLSTVYGAGLMLATDQGVRIERTRFVSNRSLGIGGAIYEK